MKIKKFNEEHLDEVEDGLDYLKQWTNSLLSKFFDEDDISSSGLFKRSDEFVIKDLILVVEFNTTKLTPKLFNDISNYLKFVEKYGKYDIGVNNNKQEGWISIEVIIFESKFPEDLKILMNTNKYNI